MSKTGAKVLYFLHVAVQQSHFPRDPLKLGGFYSQPDVNLMKDSVQPLVSGLLGAAVQRFKPGFEPSGSPAENQAALQFLQSIKRLLPPPALTRPALHGVLGALKGQD